MILQLGVDVLIGLSGVAIGYIQAIRKMTHRHTHAFEQWELTGETRKRYKSGTGDHKYPIQQRKCLGCGYIQRKEVTY